MGDSTHQKFSTRTGKGTSRDQWSPQGTHSTQGDVLDQEEWEAWARDAGIKHPMSGAELGKRLEEKGAVAANSRAFGGRYWKGFRLACDTAGPEVSNTRNNCNTTHQKLSTRVANETFPVNSVADVVAVVDDVLDEAEYEAEHAWRNQQ
jgi:hypothetical protein